MHCCPQAPTGARLPARGPRRSTSSSTRRDHAVPWLSSSSAGSEGREAAAHGMARQSACHAHFMPAAAGPRRGTAIASCRLASCRQGAPLLSSTPARTPPPPTRRAAGSVGARQLLGLPPLDALHLLVRPRAAVAAVKQRWVWKAGGGSARHGKAAGMPCTFHASGCWTAPASPAGSRAPSAPHLRARHTTTLTHRAAGSAGARTLPRPAPLDFVQRQARPLDAVAAVKQCGVCGAGGGSTAWQQPHTISNSCRPSAAPAARGSRVKRATRCQHALAASCMLAAARWLLLAPGPMQHGPDAMLLRSSPSHFFRRLWRCCSRRPPCGGAAFSFCSTAARSCRRRSRRCGSRSHRESASAAQERS